jgi:hypothetical protein
LNNRALEEQRESPYHRGMLAKGSVRQAPKDGELHDVIVEALRTTTGMLISDSALTKLLPKPYCRGDKATIGAVLAALAAAGRIHRVKVGQALLSSAHDPQTTLGRVVDQLLAQGPLTQDALKLAVKREAPGHERLLPAWVRDAIKRRRLFEHAPQGRERKKRVGLEPDVRLQIAKTLRTLRQELTEARSWGVTPEQVLEVLAGELGVALPRADMSEVSPPSSHMAERDESLVLSALEALTRECAPGALLSLRDLRARAGLDKMRFDAAVMALAHGGRAMVHHHDYPFSLSEAERDTLVRDEHGTYYVGIVLRGRA